jgi:hypothetical protein
MEFCTACTYSPECITCALDKRILDLTARCEEMAAEIAVLRTKENVVLPPPYGGGRTVDYNRLDEVTFVSLNEYMNTTFRIPSEEDDEEEEEDVVVNIKEDSENE